MGKTTGKVIVTIVAIFVCFMITIALKEAHLIGKSIVAMILFAILKGIWKKDKNPSHVQVTQTNGKAKPIITSSTGSKTVKTSMLSEQPNTFDYNGGHNAPGTAGGGSTPLSPVQRGAIPTADRPINNQPTGNPATTGSTANRDGEFAGGNPYAKN